MTRLFFAFLVWLTAQIAAAQDATPLAFAYPKFSPLPVSETSEMGTITQESVEFGSALKIIGETDDAFELELEGNRLWVRQADVFRVSAPDTVKGGVGFSASERPALRMWASVSVATEFLEASNVRGALPDFEEVLTGKRLRDLSLPVIARDTIDVMGSSSAKLAAVMVPLEAKTVKAFDRLRGAQSQRIALTFVIDVSPDAIDFALPLAESTRALVTRFLQRNGDSYDVRVVMYGANIWNDTITKSGDTVRNTPFDSFLKTVSSSRMPAEDPLLSGLEEAAKIGRDGFDSELIFVFSGSDPKPTHYSRILSKNVSLANPQITFSDASHVLLFHATPEPSRNLPKLSGDGVRAASFEIVPFQTSDNNRILDAVRAALGGDGERPIPPDQLQSACANANKLGFPCLLPYAPTTASKLPGASRRGKSADWYTIVAWTVLDGLILE